MPDVLIHETDKAKEAASYGEAQIQVAREETKRLVIKLLAVALTIFSCVTCFILYGLSVS